MFTHVAAAAPGRDHRDRYALDLAGRRTPHPQPLGDRYGWIDVPTTPGLGVELDMEEVARANRLYKEASLGGRNDAAGMQYLIPEWKFDPKRPCLVR